MSACLNWQEAFEAGAAVCGGKGYNLARLARYGFRVPRGGVLPAGAPVCQLRQGLERWGLPDARVAVRSSATAEDSARQRGGAPIGRAWCYSRTIPGFGQRGAVAVSRPH